MIKVRLKVLGSDLDKDGEYKGLWFLHCGFWVRLKVLYIRYKGLGLVLGPEVKGFRF